MADSWPPRDPHGPADDPDRSADPWAADPDAWRRAPHPPSTGSSAAGHAWPQLQAGPLYWMWLERLEIEGRG